MIIFNLIAIFLPIAVVTILWAIVELRKNTKAINKQFEVEQRIHSNLINGKYDDLCL